MSSKVKRKVTVENSKDTDDQPRRPSVFERLGPNAVNIAPPPPERHSRTEQNEKGRNWYRAGNCAYGNTFRYKHDSFTGTSSRRAAKAEKEVEVKDLRHKVKTKRDEPKESRTASASPKRKSSKRSSSRSRKGEHEGKIKSTVVVTRPRSPSAAAAEVAEPKKKPDGNWEDDSDDWPMDAAQLDYKEELTLERKRQQLQRELELELQKERLLNESVTITKTVSFSESSSTTSSSDSGSISSSSESSTSSSDDDSNDSSSSTSSSSSSSSRPITKKKGKKSFAKESARAPKSRVKDDYDKIKSSRAAKAKKARSPSPAAEVRKGSRKGRDKRNLSPVSPKKRHAEPRSDSTGRSNLNVRLRGPRTPSPAPKSRKQRQWAQSSSADSRVADIQKNKSKRHKKKKDVPRNEKRKSERIMSPPPLSSPNRTALLPVIASKKSKSRDEMGKSRHRNRDSSPLLLPRNTSATIQSVKLMGTSRYLADERSVEKLRVDDRSKLYARKDTEDLLPVHKRNDSHERGTKRMRPSPRKEARKSSLSPHRDRYDSDSLQPASRKMYGTAVAHEKDKLDRRRSPMSPVRQDRRKMELEKKRDVRELSPREHDSRRDNLYRAAETYDKRGGDPKVKRFVSPEVKKTREDKGRDHVKDRNADYEGGSWQGDHRKPNSSSIGRRTPEPRGRQEMRSQPTLSRNDPSREREQDRKKGGKKREMSVRSVEDADRARITPPRRSQSPMHGHHAVREIESLTGNRGGRMYDADIPPGDREYAYGFDSLHDPYLSERLLPSDYESDVLRGPPVYPSEVYPDSRYRRGAKEPLDRYEPRDVLSPRDVLPHRDIISLTGRGDDYLPDLPIDERPFDDRWPRGRSREDWDPYPAIPPAPLPPHMTAALDEDRYGMPRRRRASPEWQRNRIEDREPPVNQSHRQVNRGQVLPREGRSRSPKVPAPNRNSWNDRGGRNDSRGGESRQILKDNQDSQKSLDDRKGKNVRKDRGKPKEESLVDDKVPPPAKEKVSVKRPRSPSPSSPAVKPKKRRNDVQAFDVLKYHGVESADKIAPAKKSKEESKTDTKSTASSRIQKSAKQDVSSPKTESVPVPEKSEVSTKTAPESKSKEKEDRKSRKNDDGARGEDDFSDWSDDDDDLLTRDDFIELEGNSESGKSKLKVEEKDTDEGSVTSSRRKEKQTTKDSQTDSKKESSSRTGSKDRSTDETVHSKDIKPAADAKEADIQETNSLKEDTATDVDEYITAESVDYDPISDDELDALIEEPDETLLKPAVENEKSKIVDALDVDWSALMSETKTEFVPGFARERFKTVHVLSRIGFSQTLAGPELTEKIINVCQKQLDEEKDQNEDEAALNNDDKKSKKFVMEHPLAAFHVSISQNKRERNNLFSKVGPYRRALCARRDLQIRKLLCRPLNKLAASPTMSYTPQYSIVDKELYKQSLELLKLKKTPEIQSQTVLC